jgi:hypothetical protein
MPPGGDGAMWRVRVREPGGCSVRLAAAINAVADGLSRPGPQQQQHPSPDKNSRGVVVVAAFESAYEMERRRRS